MSTLCRAGRRWQKYGRAEKSAPKAFGVLPNPSFCHPSARQACRAIAVAATAGRTLSQSVAAIWRKARAKLMPFELFRGHSVIVNPPSQLVSTQSNQARCAVAVLSAVAAAAKGDAAKAGQAQSNRVKPIWSVKLPVKSRRKYLRMNGLQNKQPWFGQTSVNLVNMVKMSQSAFDLGLQAVRRFGAGTN